MVLRPGRKGLRLDPLISPPNRIRFKREKLSRVSGSTRSSRPVISLFPFLPLFSFFLFSRWEGARGRSSIWLRKVLRLGNERGESRIEKVN